MDSNYMPTAEELLQLINDILSGNQEKIDLGTKFLKGYTKKAECLNLLIQFIQECPSLEVRQFCVVLLKRNIIQLYQKVDQEQQRILRQVSLQKFFEEKSNNIKNSLGAVIGLIASIAVVEQQWPELLQVISDNTMHCDQTVRLEGLVLLGHLIESSGSFLDQYYQQFMNIFTSTIAIDQSKQVRKQTLKNIMFLFESLVDFNKEQKNQAKTLVQPVLEVLMECIKENDEELGNQTLESLQSIVETSNLLDGYLAVILQNTRNVQLLSNREVAMKLRTGILDFMMAVVEHKRKFFNKHPEETKGLLDNLIQLVNQPVVAEDYEDNEETIQDVALHLLENMSLQLHRRHVYPFCKEYIGKLIHSGHPDQMNTGLLVLASIVEGCAQSMRKDLHLIMTDFVHVGLASTSPQVKGPAIKVLCQLSEYLSPDILVYHQAIVQGLITNIILDGQPASNKINEKALMALDVIVENMEKEQIMSHLQLVMGKIMEIVQHQQSTGFMKQLAMSCVGSCVAAAGMTFQQYAQELCQFLHQIIDSAVKVEQLTDDQTGLVSETVLVLGRISYYVCRDSEHKHQEDAPINQTLYQQCIVPVMQHIYTLLNREDECALRESALSFFYNVADSIGQQFQVLLPKITQIALNIAESQKGVNYVKEKKEGEFSLDTDSEEGGKTGRVVNVKIGYMDEKAAAIYALGSFAKACPEGFQEYWGRVQGVLEDNYQQFYDNIRVQCVNCYMNLALGMVKKDLGGLPTKLNKHQAVYSSTTQEFIQIDMLTKYLYYLSDDSASEVVCQVLESLEHLVNTLGKPLLGNNINQLVQEIQLLLKGKSKCLNEAEGEEDIEEVKENVYELITDLLPALNQALSTDFNPHFQQLAPTMLGFLTPDNDNLNLVLQMIGCFAESFKANPTLIISYVQPICTFLFTHAFNFQDQEVNRNAAFCLGIMCEKNALAMQQYLPQVLQWLNGAQQLQDNLPECIDNIIAANCRIVMAGHQDPMFLNQLVNQLLSNPLFQGDVAEQKTVLRFWFYLCEYQPQMAQQHLVHICLVLVEALHKQKHFHLSHNFVQKHLLPKLQMLFNNSQPAKEAVQKYVNDIQDIQQKNTLMAML